jgi:DNA polymerase III gamma/tau subunit
MELYRKHRPKTLDDIWGQESAVSVLRGKLAKGEYPHATMLIGNSGTGKTTLVRIVKKELGCGKFDYKEINCAALDGVIDAVRGIDRMVGQSAMKAGGPRVIYLDEVQSLSRAQHAQQALLKMLEDPPDHVYYFLATTDPSKVIKTIHTRCMKIVLKPLSAEHLEGLLQEVCDKEGIKIEETVRDKIVEQAEGSAREALVLLDQIAGIDGEEERLAAVCNPESKREAIELCRAITEPRANWSRIADMVESIVEGGETGIESVRRMVLGYAYAILRKNPRNELARETIVQFGLNFFESGKAGLLGACWDVAKPNGKR